MRDSILVAAAGLLFLAGAAGAQNASVEVSQAALNKLAQRVGPFSGSGVYKPTSPAGSSGNFLTDCDFLGFLDCPSRFGGRDRIPLVRCRAKPELKLTSKSELVVVAAADPAVNYEWWIENPSITVSNGAMSFTATVRSRVGTQTNTVTRTVPADIRWSSAARRLRLDVSSFSVPLQHGTRTIATVDVADAYNIRLPVEPRTFSVPMLDGGSASINARPLSMTVQYQTGKAVLNFDLGF